MTTFEDLRAGQLEPDMRVGDWSMPWNARDGGGRLGPGIPKSEFWASDKQGIDPVGCVYTAQGFEFDYVGVIFGPDLVYRPMNGGRVGQRDQSHDRVVRRGVTEAEFTRYVKSTYRVLLTHGLRGCYVYFMDAPTRDFILGVARNGPHIAKLGRQKKGRGIRNEQGRSQPAIPTDVRPRRIRISIRSNSVFPDKRIRLGIDILRSAMGAACDSRRGRGRYARREKVNTRD